VDKMIAFCGLSCTGCDAFPANRKKNVNERKKVAEKWSELYGHGNIFKPEDIECDGCLSRGGQLFSHCSVCEIRKCGIERQVSNCAYCSDYACGKLDKFLSMVPEAKTNLEEIRKRV
jgi:hypothetical protein